MRNDLNIIEGAKQVVTGAIAPMVLAPRDLLIRNRIFLFSGPRSGSNWLAEILAGERGIVINEPFHKRRVHIFGNDSLAPHLHIPEAEVPPGLREAVGTILDFKKFPHEIYPPGQLLANVGTKVTRPVFKLSFAHLMMGWLLDNFDSPCILLIRHPCAVVASQLQHAAWSKVPSRGNEFQFPGTGSEGLNDTERRFLDSINSKAGILAAVWAITTKHAIEAAHRHPSVIITTYEKLLLDFSSEIRRIGAGIGCDDLLHKVRSQKEPSRSASEFVKKGYDAERQLERWSFELDQSDVQEILRVTAELGADYYSEEPEPDYSRLSMS